MKMTMSEGDKAMAGKGKGTARDKKIEKDAKGLLCKLICQQWYLILLGFPFVFLAAINDMFVPDYVGRTVNAFTEEEYEGPGGLYDILW